MTSSNDPDEIRRQIQATRAELSGDVDALSDKVNPASIAKRQGQKLKGAAASVKESVFGSATDVKDSASDALSAAGSAVSDAPSKVVDQTRGNPLAAGLVAFGAGMLISSLFPASRVETKAAAAVKEQAQPLVSEATDAAKEIGSNLQEPAQEALESVKSTATEAAETVKDEGKSAAGDVKSSAQDAKDTVQQTASSS